MTSFARPRTAAVTLLLIGLACTRSDGRDEVSPAEPPQAGGRPSATIDHLVPRRDFTGPAPTRFEWTAVDGAQQYSFGLWNEVDVRIWRQDRLREPSVVTPRELVLDPGTYYWSVTALRDDRPVAESGLAAFVVRQ